MDRLRIEFDVPVTMQDGTVLRADVYRPDGDGPWPVLVQRTPYNKRNLMFPLDTINAVKRGYIVVQQDTRGRFGSDGEWLPWAYEERDGYDTVEWAARLPGSNGKVGLFGASYTGNTQWTAAIAQPPHLAAIAPQVTWSDPEDGLFFRGGAIELGLNVFWSLLQSLTQLPKAVPPAELPSRMASLIRDTDNSATETYWELPSGAPPAIVRTGLPDIGVRRALVDPDTANESRVAHRYDRVMVPSLNLGGWYDIFLQGTLDNYRAMRERGLPTRLIVGPWDHRSFTGASAGMTGQVNFGLASIAPPGVTDITDAQLGWYDHWLRGAPKTGSHESGVKIFVMGINEWRDEEDWPLARAEETPLYLHQGGGLSLTAPGEQSAETGYVYDPADPVPTRGGPLVMTGEFPPGPADQAAVEARPDVLVFTSEPLQEDLEVTGRVRARLFASTDGPSTDWVVRLCDVDEKGTSRNIVDGIIRVRTEPGRIDEHDIDLWSTSIVFKAGHRLRVQVTSSNFPRWDRNPNTDEPAHEATELRAAQQTIHHDAQRPSHLILPVIPR